MSVAGSQARTFLSLVSRLRPHLRTDPGLPRRIHRLLSGDRSFGSRDRRLYRELIYTTLRHLPWIEPCLDNEPDDAVRRVATLAAVLPATASFRAAFAGPPLSGDRTELLPAWFREHCPEIFADPELEAQLRRAPLWLRRQADDWSGITAEFASLGWEWRISAVLESAAQLLGEVDVTTTEAYQSGWIEVQDLGSQLLLETIGVAAGESWLDACAGAGGKSLQLAHLVGPAGRVFATDIRPAALEELQVRAERAGVKNIHIGPVPGDEIFDGVLVDAPCSGSGTWRRAPHLKWVTTPETVARHAQLQRTLLQNAAASVGPGGRLVYATCSLSSRENEDVVASFLADHPEFQPAPYARTFAAEPRGSGLLILPARHDTDGFFVASLRRR